MKFKMKFKKKNLFKFVLKAVAENLTKKFY